MNVWYSVLYILIYVISPLAALLLTARFLASFVSDKVVAQMKAYPLRHHALAAVGLFGIFICMGGMSRISWPPRWYERRSQRLELLRRVESVGGWKAVRLGCESLIADHPKNFEWSDFDGGPLPPTLAALRPQLIQVFSATTMSQLNGLPNVTIVEIAIFGRHRVRGRQTPCLGLEISCGAGAEKYSPRPGGELSGRRDLSTRKVAEYIFEID
jgi:hypothetical protein